MKTNTNETPGDYLRRTLKNKDAMLEVARLAAEDQREAMTHNIREEMIAFVEVDGVGVALFQSEAGLKLTVSGSKEFVKEIPLHHQLQKAREEVGERIYTLQAECRERNLFSHRHGLCLCYQKHRYHSEPDQDKK